MATNTNTDLTEEDAADLQFPKEKTAFYSGKALNKVQTNCSNCYIDLPDTFILCVECDKHICSACFASGAEFEDHRNDHSYSVLHKEFALFENSNWSAKEELILLDGLINLGNWNSIAKKFKNRSVNEVKEHYDEFYIYRKGSLALPEIPETDASMFPQSIVPYRMRFDDVQDPPRYSSTSLAYRSVAGYNAARSDFELEYDSNAEDLITNLEDIDVNDPNYKVLTDLQCAVIRSYNWRLAERQKRRQIIREHGLVMLRKMVAWLHKYDTTVTQSVYDRLIRFLQFYSGQRFNYMMEGLHCAGEIKIRIARLCEFRRRGITTLEGARLHLNLNEKRKESIRDIKSFYNNPFFNTKFRNMSPLPVKRRGTFTPIEIVGMPGYEKLLPKERELCRNIRLVPLSYLELKAVLISENNKLGFLKLLTARRLLKIDVNKTRRLYDFLVEEGYVNKPNKPVTN